MKYYFLVVAIAATFYGSASHAAERVALVIGEAGYQSTSPLPQAIADADLVASTLEQLEFETTEITDATRSDLADALARFADQAKGADIAVLYYAGYGLSIGQDNYLLPVDTRLSSDIRIRLETITLNGAIAALDGAKTKLVFVNTAGTNPYVVALKPTPNDVKVGTAFAPPNSTSSSLLMSQAETLIPDANEPSSYAKGIVEVLGQPDTDLSAEVSALTAKIEANSANQALHYGAVPTGLHLSINTPAPITPAAEDVAHFNQLGDEFREGIGREKNPAMALGMYLKAAAYGAQDRAAVIAEMFDTGSGTPPNPAEATKWYLKAGPEGEYQIARRYEFGDGIPLAKYDGEMVMSANVTAGRYAEAFDWYTKAAEHGYARGQWQLGVMYSFGKDFYSFSVEKDLSLSVKWYLKAAENGYVPAMYSLGTAYSRGDGTPENPDKARQWYTKAAEKGQVIAMLELADIASSDDEVQRLYKKAAESGDKLGMEKLAFFYKRGVRGKPNYAEALKWFRAGADAGDADAMNNVGLMYGSGKGVALDYAQAGKWYERAAAHGKVYANFNLAVLFSNGLGCRKDVALAVALAELALRGDDAARKDLKSGWSQWTSEFRQALQRRLSKLGLYSGKTDGRFGKDMLAAIDALAKQ